MLFRRDTEIAVTMSLTRGSHLLWGLVLFLCTICQIPFTIANERIKYPSVRRDDAIVDNFYGYTIRDPYRWLESDSAETSNFIQEQNKLTSSFFEKIEDRERIRDKCKEIWNFPKFQNSPTKAGNYYYVWRNSGLQNQGAIYRQKNVKDDEPELFFDPNELSPDGRFALRDYYFSKSGKVFAYCLAENGTDWKSCYFKDTDTLKNLRDKLEGLKFTTLQWIQDNQGEGFFYTSYPLDERSKQRKLQNEGGWFHRMGTKQSEDTPILSFPSQPNWNLYFTVSDCGKYLMAFPNTDFKANALYLTSLERGIAPAMIWIPMYTNISEASYEYITNDGTVFYFKTDKKAPRFQIIQIETDRLKNPRFAYNTVVPEHAVNVLHTARAVAESRLFLVYMEDMKHKIEVRNLKDGSLFAKVPLDMGSVWSVNRKVRNRNELFFLFESFVIPSRVYHCTFTNEDVTCEIIKETQVANLDVSNIETKLIHYSSYDNTTIPMFIIHKKGISHNGTTPLLLYGYGGFNSNIQPFFEIQNLIFIKYFEGIYAAPALRGGGEYGEAWHAAGSLLNKNNAFRDFQAAAEYLIKEKYTNPSKLVILGTSNGGLLVGACVNKKPEIYGAAIAKVGVMDMLRYHKLGVGFWWTEEYGTPDTKEHFENLRSYSPLHNIQKYMLETIQYPAVFILTGDHDDRVVPAHSYKYAAELQHRIGPLPQQKNPLLLKVETNVGHNLGQSPAMEIREWAEIFAFISQTINVEFSYAAGAQVYTSVVTVTAFVVLSYCYNCFIFGWSY